MRFLGRNSLIFALLGSILVMLAIHPEVQEKVYEEIQSIEASMEDSNDLNISVINKMEYISQVIMETMRLFPLTTIIARETVQDLQIKSNNILIPKGTNIFLGISMLHRNQELWGPNSHKFDPENFSAENRKHRNPHAYIPYLEGPRDCVGRKYANIEMKVVIYTILKNFRLETDEKLEDIRCSLGFFVNKIGGWKLKIFSRENRN